MSRCDGASVDVSVGGYKMWRCVSECVGVCVRVCITPPPSPGVLNNITPHGVKMLRSMFNDSVLDVLYYMSPKFGPEVCVCVCVCVPARQFRFFSKILCFTPLAVTMSNFKKKCLIW